jgi:hypothetical protein
MSHPLGYLIRTEPRECCQISCNGQQYSNMNEEWTAISVYKNLVGSIFCLTRTPENYFLFL